MTALLEVENVRVRFRVKGRRRAHVHAVDGVSFRIAKGETLALVGESGSGKTTLARAIVGLVPVEEGSIRYQGEELTGLSERELKKFRRDIAMMFQDPIGSLSPRLKVRSLLAEPFLIHGLRDRDLAHETQRLLEMVGLPLGIAERYPHELSGGQARRIGVARAISLSPKLIIADEPTAGLDVSVQGEVLNLLNALQSKLGTSMLIITHNLSVARHVTARMAVMYLGRLVEEGPTDAIFARPRHPYTLALLSASPRADPDASVERVKLSGEVPSSMNRPAGCAFHPRCPIVQENCRTDEPDETEELGESGELGERSEHRYRCHHPLEAPMQESS